jgi:hypothetical protein
LFIGALWFLPTTHVTLAALPGFDQVEYWMSAVVSRRGVLGAGAVMPTVAAMGTAQAGPVRAAGREPGAKGRDKVLVVGMDGVRHDRIADARGRTSKP